MNDLSLRVVITAIIDQFKTALSTAKDALGGVDAAAQSAKQGMDKLDASAAATQTALEATAVAAEAASTALGTEAAVAEAANLALANKAAAAEAASIATGSEAVAVEAASVALGGEAVAAEAASIATGSAAMAAEAAAVALSGEAVAAEAASVATGSEAVAAEAASVALGAEAVAAEAATVANASVAVSAETASVALGGTAVAVEATSISVGLLTSLMMMLTSAFPAGAAAVNTALLGMSATATGAMTSIGVAVAGTTSLFALLKAQIVGLVAPLLGLIGAWKVVNISSDFEQMSIRIKGAFNGVTETAQNAMTWIKQFAVQTVYSVRQTIDAFMMLKGFGLDPMDGTLRKIGDAAAKWGADAGALTGISRQLGQAWSRGKLELADMNAMIDNGLPVINLLSDALGKTSAEILDMSSKGELGRDAIRKLIDEMGKQSGGQMQDRMHSLAGALSNMSDAFDNAIDRIRQSGGFNWITQSVLSFTAIIPDLVATVADMGGAVGSVFSRLWGGVAAVFQGIDGIINAVMGNSGTSTSAVNGFVKLLKVLQTLFIGLQTGIEVSFASITAVLRDFSALLIGIGSIADRVLHLDFDGAVAAWREGFAHLRDVALQGGQGVMDAAQAGKAKLDETWNPNQNATVPDNAQKPLSAGDVATASHNAQQVKALAKETLDYQLTLIKQKQDAVKNAAEAEIGQLEADQKKQVLLIEQEVVTEIKTKQQGDADILASERDLAAKVLAVKRRLIEQQAELDKQAIRAKIESEKAQLNQSSLSSVKGLIASGESGNDYNKYNRGVVGDSANRPLNLEALTLGEIYARQALEKTSADYLNAVGKFQFIASTLKETAAAAKLSADAKFDEATQEKLFATLIGSLPAVKAFVTGKSDDIAAAQAALAGRWAAVPDPATGKSRYDGQAGNAATMTTPQIQSALRSARASNEQNVGAGMDAGMAFSQALSGDALTLDEKKAVFKKIEALNVELEQAESDKVAKLKALGIDEQNATTQQATTELGIRKEFIQQQHQADEIGFQAKRDAALAEVQMEEQAAQMAVDAGTLGQDEYLAKQRDFAKQRLKIEQDYLKDRQKLLGQDRVALLQNLYAEQAAIRDAKKRETEIESEAERNKREIFQGAMGPFLNATQQMTNGVLTGQQTITRAIRNAAQNMLTSYISTFAQERVLQAAQWAWKLAGIKTTSAQEKALKNGDVIWAVVLAAKEKAVMAGQWAWEVLGFGAKETAKVGAKIGSEGAQVGATIAGQSAQTGAVAAGESARSGITLLGTLKTIGTKAAQAGAGAFSWVMTEVPWPLNIILAPVAAAAAFVGTMAFGNMASSEGGLLEVPADRIQMVHKKETILPAPVADTFRRIVSHVQSQGMTAPPATPIDAQPAIPKPNQSLSISDELLAIDQMFKSGALPRQITLPDFVSSIPTQTQANANAMVAQMTARQSQADSTEGQSGAQSKGGHTFINVGDSVMSVEEFFNSHQTVIVKKFGTAVRNFVKPGK